MTNRHIEPPARPVLYHRWRCPWCAAARQAADNVGIRLDLIEVPHDRTQRDHVRTVSGQDRVPVLVDGGRCIVDSRRIVRHLYARYGGERMARSVAELDEDLAHPPPPGSEQT